MKSSPPAFVDRMLSKAASVIKDRQSRKQATNVGWTLGAQVLAAPLRMVRFIVLARVLGIEEFGILAATTALASFFAPFSGWGFAFLLARNVARQPKTFSTWWGNGLVIVFSTALPLSILMTAIGVRILPGTAIGLLLAVGLTELLGIRLVNMAERAQRAQWKIPSAAVTSLFPEVGRLAVLPFFVAMSDDSTAFDWALWQLLGVGISAALITHLTSRYLGKPAPNIRLLLSNLRMGTHFAFGHSAGTIYSNVDRIMLGRLSTLEATGIYSAASNIIFMSKLPIDSISRAMMPRYFELGAQSVHKTVKFGFRNIAAGLVYAVPASLALYFGAPILPFLLGNEYEGAIDAVRWMAILPLLFSLSDVGGATISAIDRPQDRTKILISAAALNIALNLWLIPAHSWKGAVAATVASEVVLAFALWLIIFHWRSRASTGTAGVGT